MPGLRYLCIEAAVVELLGQLTHSGRTQHRIRHATGEKDGIGWIAVCTEVGDGALAYGFRFGGQNRFDNSP